MMLIASIDGASGEGSESYNTRIIEYDPNTGLGIARCDHRSVSLLLTILRGSTETFGRYGAKTLGVSGSIKTLRRKFLKDLDSYHIT